MRLLQVHLWSDVHCVCVDSLQEECEKQSRCALSVSVFELLLWQHSKSWWQWVTFGLWRVARKEGGVGQSRSVKAAFSVIIQGTREDSLLKSCWINITLVLLYFLIRSTGAATFSISTGIITLHLVRTGSEPQVVVRWCNDGWTAPQCTQAPLSQKRGQMFRDPPLFDCSFWRNQIHLHAH